MKHFSMRLAQRYRRPDLQMAVFLTKVFEGPQLLAYDVSTYILKVILKVNKHKAIQGQIYA